MTNLHVQPIDPERLAQMHENGHDDIGNPLKPWPVQGWEPLRCCLRIAQDGEAIALVAYSPFADRSPWSETGPVFIHLEGCPGYDTPHELPAALRAGPRVLRAYHPDGSIAYEDTVFVPEGRDIEPTIRELLERPAVDKVHVRAHLAQCFAYEVRLA
jgi:Protein of unknown function (DUF1203)